MSIVPAAWKAYSAGLAAGSDANVPSCIEYL